MRLRKGRTPTGQEQTMGGSQKGCIKKNAIVQIEFADHAEDSSKPLLFCVYGRIAQITPQFISLDSWEYADKRHHPHDANEKRFTIIRSTIININRLYHAGQSLVCHACLKDEDDVEFAGKRLIDGKFWWLCVKCAKTHDAERMRLFFRKYRDAATAKGICASCFVNQSTKGSLCDNCRSRSAIASRRAHYRKKYGITLEEYDRLFAEQGGLCAICNQPETFIKKSTGTTLRLAVDHNHTTGQNRGLLCSCCNQAIGVLKENPAFCESARDYLLKWNHQLEVRKESE